jgi:hypothetical protein
VKVWSVLSAEVGFVLVTSRNWGSSLLIFSSHLLALCALAALSL